jgi:hypothetical protein
MIRAETQAPIVKLMVRKERRAHSAPVGAQAMSEARDKALPVSSHRSRAIFAAKSVACI